MGMNVTSDFTFGLWKYVFQVPQYWKKMSLFANIGVPEKHTGCLQKMGISVFDYPKSTIMVQKFHVGVVLELF